MQESSLAKERASDMSSLAFHSPAFISPLPSIPVPNSCASFILPPLPHMQEMPRGPRGVAISEKAVHIVLYFVASGVYGTVGVFGAATYGEATESNIMVNDILQVREEREEGRGRGREREKEKRLGGREASPS